MSSFVEQCCYLVEAKQRRNITGRAGEITNDRNHRCNPLPVFVRLAAVTGTPGSSIFPGSWVKVHIEHTNVFSVGFLNFVSHCFFVINGNIGTFNKLNTIQFAGYVNHSVNHVFQLEIRFQLGIVQVVFGFAHFFGIIPPVPRFKLEVSAFFLYHGLHVGSFNFSPFECRSPKFHQEIIDVFGCFSHVDIHSISSKIVESQHFGTLAAKGNNFADDFFVVVGIFVIAAADISFVQFFAQFAVFGILKERQHAWFLQGENPFSLHAVFFCLFGSGSNHIGGKPFQVSFRFNHQFEVFIGFGQHIFTEFET